MAANKFIKLVVTGMVLTLLLGATMLSCDKRHGVNPPGETEGNRNVGNIVVSLSPNQIRLNSPEAIDSVNISVAVVDSHGVGLSGITVRITRSPNIGFVTTPDTTNAMGRTTALFVAEPGVYDSTRISVSAGSVTKTALLLITGPSRYSLNLTYSPPVPKLIDHEGDPYNITASLVDTTQRGVSGAPVTFAIINQVGRIGFADSTVTTPRTNSQGIVRALFYNTEIDEQNLPVEAQVQVTTPAPDGIGILAASLNIPLRRVQNSLSLQATPEDIVGDGTSTSLIRAFLLDTDGHGIVNDTIRFSNIGHHGSIQATVVTNDNGIATSTFSPFAGLDSTTATEVVAEYRAGSIVHQATSRINLRIMPVRSVGYLTASLQKQNVVADGTDSSSVFITVQDSTGGLIADGTVVYLANTGVGFLSAPQVQTTAGQARAKITSPANIVGSPKVDSIFVCGAINDSVMICDTAIVFYIPGPISQMQFIRPESTVTLIAGSGDTDTVLVFAVDANGNPVANGTQISFRNTIPTSSLTPQAASTMDGVARSVYLVGSGTGDDNIEAFIPKPGNPNDTIRTVHPVVYRCLSSNATTLQLGASAYSIQVGGASTQVLATLQDAFGNPLSEGYVVAFQITVSPGSSPAQKPSFDTNPGVYFDTVATNINGQAIVQLYSGTKSGAVSIKACTIPLPPESLYVCDEKSLITISSGPPAVIAISSNFSGEASNPNTPERYCQVAALVWDQYTNPCEYGTAVYFRLIPDSLAFVEGNSYTGGARPYHPDSTEGVAYTRIVYPCFSTFNFVNVIASSAGETGEVADTSVGLSLPIFEGNLAVSANPGNLWTDNGLCNCTGGPNNNCKDTSNITATLTDGGGCPVEGGVINFSALVAGTIIGQTIDTTDGNGRAFTRYMIRGCEIPCGQTACTIETTAKGTLDQDNEVTGEVNLVCSRPMAIVEEVDPDAQE